MGDYAKSLSERSKHTKITSGHCLICGTYGTLSQDHVPPQGSIFEQPTPKKLAVKHRRFSEPLPPNMIAAINIARNTFDIFAQIANALALPQPLCIEDCTISKVRDRLPKSPLKTEITRVTKLHWFRYLAGFSNTIKHRQLISHKPSQKYKEDTGEYLGGGAEVAAFKHHSREFKSYWVQEVLEGTVEMHNEHCLAPTV